MLKNLTGLRLIGTAVALLPFALAAVMFAVGNVWTAGYCLGCGTAAVVAGTWDREIARKLMRLWRNTARVREIAAAAFMLVIVLILSLAVVVNVVNGAYWTAAFNFAAAVFLATRS